MVRRGLNLRKALLGLILPLLRRSSPETAARVVGGIGRLEYRMHHRLRTTFRAAVERQSAALGANWDVEAVSSALAANQIRFRTRDLLLDGLTDDCAEQLFEVEGQDHLDVALAERRGAILLACHYGAHLLPAHWMYRHKYQLRFYMERPRHVSKYLARQFNGDGPLSQDKLFISRRGDPTSSAGSILRAAKVLQSGMAIYMAGDVRHSGQHAASATFLGRRFQFTTTWVRLAALTGAPVIAVFGRLLENGRYHVCFCRPFQIPQGAGSPGHAAAWVQRYIDILESQVRLDPTNSNDYFFWPDEESSGEPEV